MGGVGELLDEKSEELAREVAPSEGLLSSGSLTRKAILVCRPVPKSQMRASFHRLSPSYLSDNARNPANTSHHNESVNGLSGFQVLICAHKAIEVNTSILIQEPNRSMKVVN